MFVIGKLDDGMYIKTDDGRKEYHIGDPLDVKMVDDMSYHGILDAVCDGAESLYFTLLVDDDGQECPVGPFPCEMIESISKTAGYIPRGEKA